MSYNIATVEVINRVFSFPKSAEGPGKSDDVRKEEQGPYSGLSRIEESQQRKPELSKALFFVLSLCVSTFVEMKETGILSSVLPCFSRPFSYTFFSVSSFIYAVIFP